MEQVNEPQAGDALVNFRYAVVLATNVINVIMWDGVETPSEDSATPLLDSFGGAALVLVPDGAPVGPGWSYDGQSFTAPPVPPVPPMTVEQATAERDRLMAYATSQIAPLQDAVDMEEATAAEVAALTAWKKYRLAVSRTSTSAGWPGAVAWPQAPDAAGA